VLSRSAEYAVRSLSYLARNGEDEWLQSREIATELGLPPQFLTKILRRLTETGLVVSQRGRTGGFRLNRAPSDVSLLAIVMPFEPPQSGIRCLLGQEHCTDKTACPVHEPWVTIRRSFYDLLEHTTLADVAERATRGPVAENTETTELDLTVDSDRPELLRPIGGRS